MRFTFRDLPVAWLQLSHGRTKLLAAVAGIVFADLLMWMQLGFRAAAIDSSLYIHEQLRGQIVILNKLTEQMGAPKPFPRRQLVRAMGHPDVEAAVPMYTGTVLWRDPWTGAKRSLYVYGIVPHAPAIGVPGVSESASILEEEDTCLFDLTSRKEFANVVDKLKAGGRVVAEVNGRRVTVVGTTMIGASFDVDGNLVTSDANFLRLFPQRFPGAIDLGVVRVRRGADPQQVKLELQEIIGANFLVLTNEEFKERDKAYFRRTRPVDFIFTMGASVGFLVGFAIVYQVLFSDVNNHLPQYATLKAIGYPDRYLRKIVVQAAVILSLLGYLPGAALAAVFYVLTAKATSLPMRMDFGRGILILVLTITMCCFSGLMAMRKLDQADPADVF